MGVFTHGIFLALHLAYDSPRTTSVVEELAQDRGYQLPLALYFFALLMLLGLTFQVGWACTRIKGIQAEAAANSGLKLARSAWLAFTAAFIVYHVYTHWWRVARGELYLEDLNGRLSAELSSVTTLGVPLLAGFYLVGTAGVAFHGFKSLHGLWLSLRLTEPAWLAWFAPALCRALSLGVFAVAANNVMYFATGASIVDHLLAAG